MSQTEAAVRRAGALVALAAASGLLLVLVPSAVGRDHAVLALYAIFLLGCAAALLSPAHRAVAELARGAARETFGAPGRAAAALVLLLQKGSCFPASSSGAGARRPIGQAEAAVRRTGAASVLALVPAVQELKHGLLAAYGILLLGCAAVLLSPAHRAVACLARRAAEAAREIHGSLARAGTVMRWAGFTCIVFCVAGDVNARAAEKGNALLLFLLFLVGVWSVSLSMVAARDPPPLPLWLPRPPPPTAAAEEGHGHGGGEVNSPVPLASRGVVAS